MARRYIALGDAFLDQGRFADAGDAFKRALALDPYSTEASLGRHKAELFASSRTAQFDPGVIALRITSVLGDASGRIEDAHALAALGQLALTADDLDAAQDHFAAAAARRPQLAEAHNGLGLVAFERQDFQTAAAAFEEAHRIAPHHLDYRTNLASALVYSAASDQTAYDRAIKHYQIIFRSDGEMLLPYLECALAFRLSGDFQRSLKVLAHALPLFDHDEVLALDKNAHDWLLFIGGRQIVLSQATEKRLYAHLGALLSAHLVDDQAAAQRHAAQLAKPAQRWSTLIQNALEAEATDLRARHPAFGQRIDAFQATLRRVANGQLSAERS
jgi:tetratricopeptide (TPR) repeat protein